MDTISWYQLPKAKYFPRTNESETTVRRILCREFGDYPIILNEGDIDRINEVVPHDFANELVKVIKEAKTIVLNYTT